MKNKDGVVIRCLLEKKNEEMNILKVAKEIRLDYKTVHAIIKRLEKEGIVTLESFGHSHRVTLVSRVHPLIFEAEYERRKSLLQDKNLAVMHNAFKHALNEKLYVFLLFGSYAKGTQTKHSDIDVMFIVPDGKEESFEKDVSNIARSLPLPLHCLVFSESQWKEMADAKKPNVGQEAAKKCIILYGIEAFYEMR